MKKPVKDISNEKLERLAAIAGALHTEKETGALLQKIADSASEVMDAEQCVLTVLSGPRAPETVYAASRVAASRARVLSALLVPVRTGISNAGSLEVRRHSRAFDIRDLSLFQAFADLSSVALDNARLHCELSEKIAALETRTHELTEAHDRLAGSEKLALAGRLAASVSHEIRNLLTPIRLIASDPPAEGPLDALNVLGIRSEYRLIEEQVDKATAMAQGFLSFARQGSSEKEMLDLNAAVTKARDLLHPRFRKGRITLETVLAKGLPAVLANALQVEQVLINLIKNAEDAMKDKDNGEIRITTTGEKGRVFLRVCDNGSGIRPEHLEKLSQPFFTTKPEGEGTGLGLTVCRHIVNQHQGTLRVESEWGKGTTVEIDFPTGRETMEETVFRPIP
ncbi:MAG: ATP-binding protein [Fibrobacterota bacterium]